MAINVDDVRKMFCEHDSTKYLNAIEQDIDRYLQDRDFIAKNKHHGENGTIEIHIPLKPVLTERERDLLEERYVKEGWKKMVFCTNERSAHSGFELRNFDAIILVYSR